MQLTPTQEPSTLNADELAREQAIREQAIADATHDYYPDPADPLKCSGCGKEIADDDAIHFHSESGGGVLYKMLPGHTSDYPHDPIVCEHCAVEIYDWIPERR